MQIITSVSFIRATQSKTTFIGRANLKCLTTASIGKDAEQLERLYLAGENIKMGGRGLLGREFDSFLQS